MYLHLIFFLSCSNSVFIVYLFCKHGFGCLFSWIYVMAVLTVDLISRTNPEDCFLLDSVSASVCLGDCVHVIGFNTAICYIV